ncbi:SDR family oxidoreductase [Chryseolinea soli]|uniref:SDR family oxidoreductase n=1 Tax=Chryseolinea soli TaxID=2321403 RepID=A0A385SP70_9BACT|nr:SDR family oxidoreductase [Chryseolinea soli]AYB33533.1 SDR family oxidoreductase [Chryseolinea soli]
MSAKKVVVAGATGSLGSKIVKALLERGAEVTAMVRATSKRSKLEEMGVKHFVVGDMMDNASLREALSPGRKFDAIVASAAGYTRHSKSDSTKTDTMGYRNLVDAAKEAGIPRFVLISILESDKAVTVPHFHNKYLTEKYLAEKQQPFVALRPGAFFDWADDFMLRKIKKGIVPMFFDNVDYGTIYTPDLARYAAIAATSLPESEVNTAIDVGWATPVNGDTLAAAFEKVLRKPMLAKAVVPAFVIKAIAPIFAMFSHNMKDMLEMVKWVNTGVYVSRNTERQKKLFGDLPTIEEAITRYCRDRHLI